eukprot:gene8255-5775_t
MKHYCSNACWSAVFSRVLTPAVARAYAQGRWPATSSARYFSDALHASLALRHPVGGMPMAQLREAVLDAISRTGKPEEAKSLEDVQAHLSPEVKRAIQASTPAGGKGGLAGFLRQNMSQEVQFLSEDNIQHSRIILRSMMPKAPPQRRGGGGNLGHQGMQPRPPLPPKPTFDAGPSTASPNPGTGRPRTMIETLDRMVDYLPTSFVQASVIASKMPKTIQELYADTNFIFFMKRFRHYVDIRTQHGYSELRLKQDFSHPRRGKGDELYNSSFADSSNPLGNSLRRPPRNSEANLVGFLAPRMPTEYTPIATVLSDVSDIVSRHPAFDPRLGVTGLLEKYPDYFQFNEGQLRSRPYRSAPFSLDDFDVETSPEKEIFKKLFAAVEAAAEGKNYAEEKAAAAVSTGKLYALLSQKEKVLIKNQYRSFPRFLRLHGKAIVVSPDCMKVHLFKPEYEACADTLLDIRLRENKLSPDDPVLKIPATIADNVSIDWAIKELYDALPLTQCAELNDILSLVPPSVRSGIPDDLKELQDLLNSFPEYFTLWPYPDDPSVIIIQRAKVEIPEFSKDDLVGLVLPLLPDNEKGLTCAALMRRVPLPLQRCFYKKGMKKTLALLQDYLKVTDDGRVIRIDYSELKGADFLDIISGLRCVNSRCCSMLDSRAFSYMSSRAVRCIPGIPSSSPLFRFMRSRNEMSGSVTELSERAPPLVPSCPPPVTVVKNPHYQAVFEREGNSDHVEGHPSEVIASTEYAEAGTGLEFSIRVIVCCVVGITIMALLLTATVPVGNADPPPWDKISAFIGWMYFLIWGISFIPQLIINYRRHSVVGQSLDYVALNTFGFTCLSLYNLAFFSFSSVKTEYARRYNGETSTVVLNDVCFAFWALGASILNSLQAVYYTRDPHQHVMLAVRYGLTAVAGLVMIWLLCIVLFGSPDTHFFNTLALLYGLSYIKLGISCVKYLPQLYMNYKRKRTDGWSIENVLCDFSGGLLSVMQQLLDSFITSNYSGISGNPVKFILGSLSMVYDVVFVVQHFVLYRRNTLQAQNDEFCGDLEESPSQP